jgi:hypothetical protein
LDNVSRVIIRRSMKRIAYVILFTLLGIFLNFLIHAVLEMSMVHLLVINFDTYGLGLRWDHWFYIHHVGTIILFVTGIAFVFWQGRYWWGRVYGSQ